jgi:FAD binding domain
MTSTVGVPDLTGAIDTDVLIVGAGGRGLALSLLLADYGADHLQIERHPDTAIQPKGLSIFGAREMRPAWTAAAAHRQPPMSGLGLTPRTTKSTTEGIDMKIIAYDWFRPGVTLETVGPYLDEECATVWRLLKAGIVREIQSRADEPGVLIVFELDSVEEARRYADDFPLSRAGLIEWFFLPLTAPLPIEFLFRPEVDVAEPFDRTAGLAVQ